MIDWSRVSSLRSEIGEDDFAEIAALFMDEVEEVIDRLRADGGATTSEDFHFLKGSALNLGFAEFAGICAEGEDGVRSGADAAPVAVRAVVSYDASRTMFLRGLESHDAMAG